MKTSILTSLVVIFLGFGSYCKGYTWSVSNHTSSPIDVRLKLASALCPSKHWPSVQQLAPGDTKKLTGPRACCLSDVEVNGQVVHLLAGGEVQRAYTAEVATIVLTAGLGSAVAPIVEGVIFCHDRSIEIATSYDPVGTPSLAATIS